MPFDSLNVVLGVLDRRFLVNVELTIPLKMVFVVDVFLLYIVIEVVQIIYC